MTKSCQLSSDFKDRLFEILSEMTTLRYGDNRNRLLRELPSEPIGAIPRNSAWQTDLYNILEAAEGWGELVSGELALVVIAQNALSLAEGTQPGRKLEALLAEFDRPIPTTSSSIHGESQKVRSSNQKDIQNSTIKSNEAVLEIKLQELEQARKEYYAAVELVHKEEREVNDIWEVFGEYVILKNNLTERRDLLNEDSRKKRKEIRTIEKQVEVAQEELEDLEVAVKEVRREIPKVKRKLDQAFLGHKSAEAKSVEAEQLMELATQKLKDAEVAFQAAGGILQERKVVDQPTLQKNNPWISGSFYLFAIVVIMTLLAVISANVSWYALVVVFVGGLLAIAIVGALQLRNDETLSEENFLTLMIESFKRIPLLRSDKVSNKLSSNAEPLPEPLNAEESQQGLANSSQSETK